MMKVNRRGLFGVFAGAAASGKAVIAKADELMATSRINDAFKVAGNIQNGLDSVESEGVSSCKPATIRDKKYWLKELANLKKSQSRSDYNVQNRQKLEVECLKSVSFSHKTRMIEDIDWKFSSKREEKRINRYLKNILAGRYYHDNGED